MKTTIYEINRNGIDQIAAFLKSNHRRGEIIPENHHMLGGYVDEAELELREGRPASIEIKSRDSIHGVAQYFTISADGLDSREVGIDD